MKDLRPANAYRLPAAVRGALAKAHGRVVQDGGLVDAIGDAPLAAAVGDVVSLSCKRLGLRPHLFICDFKTQRGDHDANYRRELGTWGDHVVTVANPAGTLTRQAWDAVRAALGRPGLTRIEVDGEEDLLGIPCFLESPLGSKVLYGLPGQGAVVVDIDTTFQALVRDIVARMEPC